MFWRVLALIVVGTLAIVTIGAAVTLLRDPGNTTALTIFRLLTLSAVGLFVLLLAFLAFVLPTSAIEDEDSHDDTPQS